MYFLDTEFNQGGHRVELLSIGIVSDDGREYYAQNQSADLDYSNEFVRSTVLPLFDNTSWKPVNDIKDDLLLFMDADIKQEKLIEIWTYYGSYDWVAVCGTLFGDMTATPKGFPFAPMDIQQYARFLGVKIAVPKPAQNHNALADARWNQDAYKWLKRQETKRKTVKTVA